MNATMSVTRDEYKMLRDEFDYLCDLSREADKQWFDLDFREGVAHCEGNQKHIRQCARLKVKARRRAQRRHGKAMEVYEEMDQELLDLQALGMFKVKFKADGLGHSRKRGRAGEVEI